ncbi:hypothetical protein EDC17_104327 [Sphingobacterium alimentarium]|uniref:Uncharacterized protein n=1 Tax=Sphingobacterium alimentarium TaxID=797292 RepID=A0A4R3VU07_9SPHI|nr:hypothetical protein EDC17_104327 [Sphingobacterium alimentarium]
MKSHQLHAASLTDDSIFLFPSNVVYAIVLSI